MRQELNEMPPTLGAAIESILSTAIEIKNHHQLKSPQRKCTSQGRKFMRKMNGIQGSQICYNLGESGIASSSMEGPVFIGDPAISGSIYPLYPREISMPHLAPSGEEASPTDGFTKGEPPAEEGKIGTTPRTGTSLERLKELGRSVTASVMGTFLPGPAGAMTGKSAVWMVHDLKKPGRDYENFRTTLQEVKSKESVSLAGLKELNVSGSSEFSEKGLTEIRDRIGRPMIVIDLREEPHGFINGLQVSWRDKHNAPNIGATPEQVEKDEEKKLRAAKDSDSNVKSISTEEALCRKLGIGYERIAVTDQSGPEDRDVDQFISFVVSLPPDSWPHFHCKAGMGRTTCFMAMYDMMHNASNVSLEDIIERQHLLGGADMFNTKHSDPWEEQGMNMRADFLREFYQYCRESGGRFKESWSSWHSRHSGVAYDRGAPTHPLTES